MTNDRSFVIIGASLTGAKAAETLREEGFTGRILLIGTEVELPYERPPLSKGFLMGSEEKDSAFVHDSDWYTRNDIDLRLNTTVTGIDRAAHEVELNDAERVSYTKLLIATGASPRRLDLPGGNIGGVHYLRRFADSQRLRKAIRGGAARVVVIGAGWIGLETAAAARTYGCPVTVVEPQSTPLATALGPDLGEYFADVHRHHGVDLRLGQSVANLRGTGEVSAVVTSDGEDIPADVVIVGIGAKPNTSLAEAAGLAVDDGIVTDAALCTDDPDVYAAGDVASAFHPFFGERVRVEHWDNAVNAGPAVARSMLGESVSYDKMPYFFTDQYDIGMEFSGRISPSGNDAVVIRGDTKTDAFYAFWLAGDTITAGMHINQWDDGIDVVTELIAGRTPVDPVRLADPGVAFSDVVR